MKKTTHDPRYAHSDHPVNKLEPVAANENIPRALETYNWCSDWILNAPTLEKKGQYAAQLARRCNSSKPLPSSGLFKSLTTPESNQMAKVLLCFVLEWVVATPTHKDMGARAVVAFFTINKELSGGKSGSQLGDIFGVSKQAYSQKKKKFLAKVATRL